MKDLYSWIDNNIESDLSVDEIVARSGYSRRHLYNLFVQQTGKSVAEYIRLKKLRYAATLLKLTHMSIVDISIRFGFDSSQSFSRLFKKIYQLTPSDYRRSHCWDISKYIVDNEKPSWLKAKVIYIGENIGLSGKDFNYEFDVSHRDSSWKPVAKKIIQDLKKEVMSFGRREIFTHIEYSPSFYNKEKVSVNYMMAEKCSLSESIKNIDIGIYLKVYYHGSIDDIIGISKLAYTQFLLKSDFIRRSGCDFEYIRVNSDGSILYSYNIPVSIK